MDIKNTTKKITVVDTSDPDLPAYSREIGAEAENIEVSRNHSGQIVQNGEDVIKEELNVTLNNIENKTYNVNDASSTDINDTDYIPISNSEGTEKKKSTWAVLISKIKEVFGIQSETGDETKFLNKKGEWTEPANTWEANSVSKDGYVTKGNGQNNKIWKTDANGNPSWREYDNLSFHIVDTLDANVVLEDGIWQVRGSITNAPLPNQGIFWNVKNIGTPHQIYMPDSLPDVYKRWYINGAWTDPWTKLDTNTWRGIQNNLTSESTTDSLAAAQGNALAHGSARDSTKLPTAGGTMTGIIDKAGSAVSWIKGRDSALVKINSYKGSSGSPSYSAILSDKTLNGSWEFGTYDLNAAYLTYCTDANYNSNTNQTNGQYKFPINVNADLSQGIKEITRNGTTFTAKRFDNSTFTFTQQDNNTTYSAGSNITLSGTTFSVTKANVISALGYTPPTTNTTYTGTNGISLSGTTFSNSGVRAVSTGTANGTISVNTNGTTANVAVKGLGSAAYTNSTAYGDANTVSRHETSISNLNNIVNGMLKNFSCSGIISSKDLIISNDISLGQANSINGDLLFFQNSTKYYGKIAPINKFTANRTMKLPNADGVIQVSSSSSRRVKENIKNMSEDKAKKLLNINIVDFDYIGNFGGGLKNQCGVIAEDTLNIIPEAVEITEGYDETKPIDENKNPAPSVDYRKFIPYLIKMVQIQQKEIDELKTKIKGD